MEEGPFRLVPTCATRSAKFRIGLYFFCANNRIILDLISYIHIHATTRRTIDIIWYRPVQVYRYSIILYERAAPINHYVVPRWTGTVDWSDQKKILRIGNRSVMTIWQCHTIIQRTVQWLIPYWKCRTTWMQLPLYSGEWFSDNNSHKRTGPLHH